MTTRTLASAGQSKYTSGYNNHGAPTTGVSFVNRGTIGLSTTQWGAIFYGSGNTLANYGFITEPGAKIPPGAGVGFAGANDVLYNHAGGTLGSGYEFGVYTANDSAVKAPNFTLINAGLISGAPTRYSVDIEDSGIVTNLSTGTISNGIIFFNGYTNSGDTATSNVSVVNSGIILGVSNPNYKYAAIYARNGGAVTNLAGTISGGTGVYGIRFANANALNVPGTVTNAATISGGSGSAIVFAALAGNRVIDKSGGVFIGTVNGGSNATMELASTVSAGVLTATSSQFTNFSGMIIDSGARWTIKGDSGLSSEFGTITGFTVGETISLTGLAQTPTTFASSTVNVGGTTHTSVTIKAGSTGLETFNLVGSIASSSFGFVAGATSTLTVNLSPPSITSISPDTGASSSDGITDTGALTVNGTALAGTTITLFNGLTQLSPTAITTGGGTWSIILGTPLAAGNFTLSATATLNGVTSSPSSGFAVDVDTTPPAVTESLSSDTGSSNSDKITSNDTVTGGGDANAVVTIKEGGTTLGTTTANASGTWSFSGYSPALSQGSNTIVASETDTAGNTGSASVTFTLDTTPPAVTESLVSDTGSSNSDKITSNDTVTGGGDANAVVTIKEGGTTLGTTTANASGTWSFSAYSPALSQGSNTIVASETDSAGNTGSASVTFTLDTTPPAVTESLVSDTGSSGSDKITSNDTVTGGGDANAVVTIKEGVTTLGTTAANGSGTWSFSGYSPALSQGSNTIVASETDTAGNTGSASVTFTLDTTAPTVSSIDTVGSNPNHASTEQFAVTFSEPVTGVDMSDFSLAVTPGVAGTIASVNGSGDTYTVEVDGVSGVGTMRLDLDSSGTGITDAAGNGPAGGFTGGEAYKLNTPCYLAGTRILTTRGEVAVEDLVAGDRAIVASGAARTERPVVWIGHRRIDLDRHADPFLVYPIRIRANAIAEGQPHRDLLVSPDHAVFIGGALIPARLLVNGASIAIGTSFRTVTYFHVELDRHDILLAEGLAAESYLDTGNREMFANAGVPPRLHPDFAADQAAREAGSCAPFWDKAEQLEPVWRTLAARAVELGWRLPDVGFDPEPHIISASRRLRPIIARDGRYVFAIPPGDQPLWLMSRAGRPCDLVPWADDRRRLGVAVRRLTVRDGQSGMREVPMDDPALTLGWREVEQTGQGPMRWTSGRARLPDFGGGILILELAGCPGYLLSVEDRIALAA